MNFSDLIKQIRKESGLTQSQLATVLGVSTVLIAMIETGQKPASKNMVVRLAKALNVHPLSLAPSLFFDIDGRKNKLSGVEKSLIDLGMKLQEKLIKEKSGILKTYALT